MAFGLRSTVIGPTISPNLGLARSLADDLDDAAAAFGSRLLTRIDPRDVRKDALNPTGAKRVHRQAPNRDPLLFTGSGVSVGPISGKYGGKDVFVTTNTGTSAAGTHNNLSVGPKSLNGVTEFTVFGVAHFDSGMLGAGFRVLLAMYRDKSAFESMIAYQFTGGVNYLSAFADQGAGGGANINLDTTTLISAGTPFAYMFRVVAADISNGLSRVALYINNVDTEATGQGNVNMPETGSVELFLGHGTSDSQQWPGGLGRHFVVAGSTIDNVDDRNRSAELMSEMKAYHGIA